MILFVMVVTFVSIYEIRNMFKKRLFKELVLFCILASITVGSGIIYFLNSYKYSLAGMLLNILR